MYEDNEILEYTGPTEGLEHIIKKYIKDEALKNIPERFKDCWQPSYHVIRKSNNIRIIKNIGAGLNHMFFLLPYEQYRSWRYVFFTELKDFKDVYDGDFYNDSIEDILYIFEWSTKALTYEETLDAIEIINELRGS